MIAAGLRLVGVPVQDTEEARKAATLEELVLDHVLERLMRTVLSNDGAERGVLLLSRGAALVIDAVATSDPPQGVVGLGAATPIKPTG